MRVKVLAFLNLFVVAVASCQTPTIKYSNNELSKFQQTRIMPIWQSIVQKKLPFPEINERVVIQDSLIAKRFKGKPIKTEIVSVYNPTSRLIRMTSGINAQGFPNIIMYTPVLMDYYVDPESFETSFIRSIMHERDHLTETDFSPMRNLVADEIHIHALTTEYILIPLIGKYKRAYTTTDFNHYTKWLESGRNEKSPVWIEHIKRLSSK